MRLCLPDAIDDDVPMKIRDPESGKVQARKSGRGYGIPAALLTALALLLCCVGCSRSDRGKDLAERIAGQIAQDSALIEKESSGLAAFTRDLYRDKDRNIGKVDRSRYGFASSGVFYKMQDDGGAALWISGAVPITRELQETAYLTEPLDGELKRICSEVPAVVQAYYNDSNSLNRIYPWMDTLTQYEPGMNIPKFNFYYLADEAHNPARAVVWVDEPYVDPAGRGWMVSAIAPVYKGNRLLGVVGLDITLAAISERYINKSPLPVAVIARNGVLVAATEDAIAILEMPRPKDHRYLETVKTDTFKQDDYNVTGSTVKAVRELAASLAPDAALSGKIDIGQKHYNTNLARLPGTGFTVVVFTRR
jgi:hypothetical protein